MNEFNEMLDKAGKPKPEDNFEGSFECQQCFVEVESAHYDATAQRLTWVCPNGHKSKIEEFRL